MAKDPAFLFYSSDFLSGVQDLTMEERGQYITLLSLQHQKGHLSEKIIKLSVGNATADVMAKFRQDSAGLWYNQRLDEEKEKRAANSKKQSERAKEGWKKRKDNATAYATAMPLEDENDNEDVIDRVIGEGKYFIIINPDTLHKQIIKIYGASGLNEFYQEHRSSVTFPEHAEKFMRDRNGKHFKDFKHVWNDFNLFVKQQFK